LLLACQRVAPDWELAALRALIKPQTKGSIEHRPAEQPWPAGAAERVEAARQVIRDRIGFDPVLHFPSAGDYRLVAEISPRDLGAARALVLLLSTRLPGAWFVLGRLFVRDGRFFRRQRGWKLNLVPATNVHLPRDVRAALRGEFTRANRPPPRYHPTSANADLEPRTPCKPSRSSPRPSRPPRPARRST
jgi:hypothetical protein